MQKNQLDTNQVTRPRREAIRVLRTGVPVSDRKPHKQPGCEQMAHRSPCPGGLKKQAKQLIKQLAISSLLSPTDLSAIITAIQGLLDLSISRDNDT